MAVTHALSLTLKAKLFRGLGDPSRLVILDALREGERSVSEIAACTGLSQPNTSTHLSCLRECGLLETRQEGRYTFYRLADSRVVELLGNAEAILADVADRIYRCSRYDSSPKSDPRSA